MIPGWSCFICMAFILLMSGCTGPSNPLSSRQLDTKQQRVEALGRYLHLPTGISDCEFLLYDVNPSGSRGIPGPTDRDYQAVMCFTNSVLEYWTNNRVFLPQKGDLSWTNSLDLSRADYRPRGGLLWYQSQGAVLAICPQGAVVFYRLIQH